MTYEEIDERYRRAVLAAGAAGDDDWDDPERPDVDEDDREIAFRDPDEDQAFDEVGSQEDEDER